MSTIGEAIATARRANGISQEALADMVGVTQATLSRYENGMREPADDALERIADTLGVTAKLLKRAGRQQGAMAVDAHLRRRATAKATVWRQLEARLNMLRMHTQQLLEEISATSANIVPSFDPIDVTPAEAARMVRMQWHMPIGPVRSLARWLESAGCVIVEDHFGTSRVDALSQWIDDRPVLLVNAEAPTDRKRLTLAHELGHLCLHRSDVTEDVERDANTFAAEFLMPAEVIRPQLRSLTLGKLHDLKREWGVSMQALIERAHGLGYLTASQRTSFYQQFSARGWRTREPVSDELLPERPALAQAVASALLANGWTQVEIDELAGFKVGDPANPFRVARGLHAVP